MLEKKCAAMKAQAKMKMKKKDKRGAMMCLKRKKMYETELNKLSTVQLNLEQQILALEDASVNLDIVGAMKTGKNELSHIQKQTKIEDVEDLQDDIQEGMQAQEELSNLLGESMGDPMDEDDLEAELMGLDELDELGELEEGEADATASASATAAPSSAMPSLPDAPTGNIDMAFEAEDEDAAALRARSRNDELSELTLWLASPAPIHDDDKSAQRNNIINRDSVRTGTHQK